MNDRQKRLAWAAVIVAVATGGSRVIGLAREMITAAYYGVNPAYNTFVSVSVIPNLIRQVFADAAVSAAFVPALTRLLTKGERERAVRLASALLTFMIVVVGGVTLVFLDIAPWLVHLVYPHLTAASSMRTLAAHLLQILLPTVTVLAVGGVVTGVLYSFERFTMPAVVSILWNLVIIAFMAGLHGRIGVYAIAWGTLVGTIVELALLFWAMRGLEFGFRAVFAFGDPLLRKVLVLMVPITLTLGILNFNALIDTFFAQFVSNHAAAQIGYAFRLYQLPQGMFAVAIGTVLFPSLSRFAALDDIDRFRETISTGTRQVFFVSLPFVAWFLVMPDAFIRVIYQHGHFNAAATTNTAAALAFFAIGLAFANANVMFNRGFQSLQRPWLPLWVGLINLVLNAVLDAVLYRPLGVGGITLSTSLVSTFNFFALIFLMRRQITDVDGRRIARSSGLMLACTALLAGASLGVWRLLHGFASRGLGPLVLAAAVAVMAGGLVYVGAARAFKVEELAQLRSLLRRRRDAGPVEEG
jgi:putative peptidoglycan lipid II flippase